MTVDKEALGGVEDVGACGHARSESPLYRGGEPLERLNLGARKLAAAFGEEPVEVGLAHAQYELVAFDDELLQEIQFAMIEQELEKAVGRARLVSHER